jgi:hypothetical protein
MLLLKMIGNDHGSTTNSLKTMARGMAQADQSKDTCSYKYKVIPPFLKRISSQVPDVSNFKKSALD